MKIEIPTLIAGSRADAYLVGGSVRDLICGSEPMDYDIAVSSAPLGLARELAIKNGGRIVELGKDTFTVYRVASSSWNIDITVYKGDNIRQDLLSRDFTINSLACALADAHILDITGGMADLRQGIVRMISPDVFKNDPVRLVRAFRMAAMMNFRIEPQTVDAIRTHAALITATAKERVWAEFIKILACPSSFKHLMLMADTRVLGAILPELTGVLEENPECSGAKLQSANPLQSVQELERILSKPAQRLPPEPARFVACLDSEARARLKLSLLLHGIGKSAIGSGSPEGYPRTGGYAARSAAIAEVIGRRLKMSNRQRQWVVSVVRRHRHPLLLFSTKDSTQCLPPVALGHFLMQCGHLTPFLLLHAMAASICNGGIDDSKKKKLFVFLGEIFTIYCERKAGLDTPPILNGDELIGMFNLPASPFIGKILRRLKEYQLAGRIVDRRQAIKWLTNYLSAG